MKSDISPECKVRSNEKPVRRETKEGPFTAPASHTDRLGNKEPGHQRLVPRGLKKKKRGKKGGGVTGSAMDCRAPEEKHQTGSCLQTRQLPATRTHTHTPPLGGGGCLRWLSVLMQLVADERGRKREEGWAK